MFLNYNDVSGENKNKLFVLLSADLIHEDNPLRLSLYSVF